jgi:hypothetical protein
MCEYCGARPDEETFAALRRQLLDLRFGEYVDADPGRWLTWHGRGIYGRTRYACGAHRGELKAELREQYGSRPAPVGEGPAPVGRPPRHRPSAPAGALARLDLRFPLRATRPTRT